MLSCFLGDDGGATSIEYGMIAVLIGVAVIVAVFAVGTETNTMFQSVADAYPS